MAAVGSVPGGESLNEIAPTELEVRIALRSHLASASGQWSLIEELWIPQTHERVDVALVDSLLRAFEIKSQRDNLSRLPRQVGAYSRIFDECTVVVAERHRQAALEIVPSWWGVWVVTAGNSVNMDKVRHAERNSALDGPTLVRLLWRDELREVLTLLGTPPPAGAGRSWMWAALLDQLDQQGLRNIVTRTLLCRDPAQAKIPTRRFLATSSAVAR
ncbi:sce7726 family protein [Hamadaea sp. NPDC050747]|uniref:sce7726 family protein n=1 Tax=Hamadaea sp. NPDC050747 TaxID=3155789 RepID=UPI0033E451AC